MSNRLGEETSPYLKQHADNPVHWHAWNDEALAGAAAGPQLPLLWIAPGSAGNVKVVSDVNDLAGDYNFYGLAWPYKAIPSELNGPTP